MYILSVIPLKKGIAKEHLSYFSPSAVPLGTIVTVPVRSKTIHAIVIEQHSALENKSEIKNKEYQIKKIISIVGQSPLQEGFLEACIQMKEYNIARTGDIISSLVPEWIITEKVPLPKKEPKEIESDTQTRTPTHEKNIFQATLEDRLSWYRTLIRESFAKKQSLFVCVPTLYDSNIFSKTLGKGIEQYTYIFHSDISKKKLLENYHRLMNEEHPVLIIGTGMFLSIPRDDIQTLIVEKESSDAHKHLRRPYIDIRTFAEIFARTRGIKLILGDTFLRPETLYRHDQKELSEVAPPLFRLPHVERQICVDMKEEMKEGKKKFTTISKPVEKMIEYALEHKESVFLYTLRKGLAGVTACNDCGHTIVCRECGTPTVLYNKKTTGERIFMCNKCGHKETTELRCPHCESWNLVPIGIGTDRVYEDIKTLFPQANIIQIDKEHAESQREARKLIELFEKNPGTILIGTERALSYIVRPVTHSAIISIDGLLSIPSFNITQKILHTIEKLHACTERNLVIQTREPDNEILTSILEGNILPLYRKDLSERKHFGYPPFKRLIKITFSGTKIETERARAYIDKICREYEPQIFSAFTGAIRGQFITNTILKLDREMWPIPTGKGPGIEKTLQTNLLNLPPSFQIIVDPEDLL